MPPETGTEPRSAAPRPIKLLDRVEQVDLIELALEDVGVGADLESAAAILNRIACR